MQQESYIDNVANKGAKCIILLYLLTCGLQKYGKSSGGTGVDGFDFSAGGSVSSIDGNGGSNTIIGQNALNSWLLTDVNVGGRDWINSEAQGSHANAVLAS